MNTTRFAIVVFLAVTGLSFSGCGQRIASIPVSTSGFSANATQLSSAAPAPTTTPVNVFKFCVKRIKLEGADGNPIREDGEKGDNGEANPDDIKFPVGLVDASSGLPQDLGKADIPVGYLVSEIGIKVKKDQTLCGVDYSVNFNGLTTVEDIEFKFRFNPPVDLSANTQKLTLSLNSVVTALTQAAATGALTSIKQIIEGTEGSAAEN